METVAQVIARLPSHPTVTQLKAPTYQVAGGNTYQWRKVGLAVASMVDHMTDEGYQIFKGLEFGGYILQGHGFYSGDPQFGDQVHVPTIIDHLKPSVVVVQDKREWDSAPRDFRDTKARFQAIEALKERPDIFKVTIVKDAQQRPFYHRQSAEEMGCHAWICYYHPAIVCHLAPYIRPQHLIRTYHSIDVTKVPAFSPENRKGCILSGAISGAYPLRTRLVRSHSHLPEVDYLKHPGYHRRGCATPSYLETLSRYKVAICTSSMYGYALRKIIEATAAGCRVITNLPKDEVLPGIDGNLVRIDDCIPNSALSNLLNMLYESYDPEIQRGYSLSALAFYNYPNVTSKLYQDIEAMRLSYQS